MNIEQLQDKLTKLNINASNRDIARIWGMDEAAFSRKKKFGSEIKLKNIQQLEAALKIDLIDKSTKSIEDLKNELSGMQAKLGIPSDKNTTILTYRPDVYLSAGYGVEVYSEQAEFLTIDSRILETEKGTKINPEYCEVVRVSGNSMSPEYRHGDRVIIDRNDTELSDGHIYAFRYKGQCYVKEINLLGDKIKCISLNKDYDSFYINKNEDFMVLGRILPRIRL